MSTVNLDAVMDGMGVSLRKYIKSMSDPELGEMKRQATAERQDNLVRCIDQEFARRNQLAKVPKNQRYKYYRD